LRSVGAVPAHVAGRFRDAAGFQQAASGQYYVFDRRSHVVFGLDTDLASAWEIVHIGGEEGRIIDPTAFAVEPNGTFVVADAPNNRERIQIFTSAGFRIGGFLLPGRLKTRVVFDNAVLNGIGSLQYTGTTILMSQPETGALITIYALNGGVHRTIGALRRTGHEDDRELHLALNSGIPLVDPTGGFYFVFQTGEPVFRKYDADGQLVFERRMQGREIDELVANLPSTWPMRKTDEGEVPLVRPTIRTASVDRAGNLWVAFVIPYTYVFDRDGDKVRTVQFRGAGVIAPTSLFFGTNNRVLVTPGLYEFAVPAASGKPADAGIAEGSDPPELADLPDAAQ
jgi:DNA-binding beta-propeller fold protein YncE